MLTLSMVDVHWIFLEIYHAVAACGLILVELHDRNGIAVQQSGDIVIEEQGCHAVAQDGELGDDGWWE